jgi:hypothetical protein
VPTTDEVTTLMVRNGSEVVDKHDIVVVKQAARQLLFLYSWFYKVIMLESTNATDEGKMQMYF